VPNKKMKKKRTKMDGYIKKSVILNIFSVLQYVQVRRELCVLNIMKYFYRI